MDSTDNEDTYALKTPTPQAVFPPSGPPDTRQHAPDNILYQTHTCQKAYMQASLEPLVPDVDVLLSPNSNEARAYTHSVQQPAHRLPVTSTLQIPQAAATQEPSTPCSITSRLPLAGPFAARSEGMAEVEALSRIPTIASSSSGSIASSVLQDLVHELERESAAHRGRPSAALPEDHTGEAPFVMKLPRSGLTTWRPLVTSRLQDVDGISSEVSPVKNTSHPATPEPPTTHCTASHIGAKVRDHGPTPVLTSPCEPAALPPAELGVMPHGDSEHSPAVYAVVAGPARTEAPTSAQVFVPDLATSDVTILSQPSVPEGGGGQKHDILPDATDEAVNLVISLGDPSVSQALPLEDVVPLARDQNEACVLVTEPQPVDFASESAVIPSAVLEPTPPEAANIPCPEMPFQLVPPETVGCESSEAPIIGVVGSSSPDSDMQLVSPPSAHPTSETAPTAAEEDITEDGSSEATMPVSTPEDHVAPATIAEADDVCDMDASCDHLDSRELVTDVGLRGAIPADLDLKSSADSADFNLDSSADSGIPCSAASFLPDAPMDCTMEPPPASDDLYPEALLLPTTAEDVAAPLQTPAASVSTDTELTGLPSSEDVSDDSTIPLSAVAQDTAQLQDVEEHLSGADDALVLPVRTEEAVVEVQSIVSVDYLQAETVISDASATSGLANALENHTEEDVLVLSTRTEDSVSVILAEEPIQSEKIISDLSAVSGLADNLDDRAGVPMPSDSAGPDHSQLDVRPTEGLEWSDDIAGDVHSVGAPEGDPATTRLLPQQVDTPRPEPSSFAIAEDPHPAHAPDDRPVDGSAEMHVSNPTVCSPTKPAALPSSRPDIDAMLEVDLADYYAALPDSEDGSLSLADSNAAMPIADDLPSDVDVDDLAEHCTALPDPREGIPALTDSPAAILIADDLPGVVDLPVPEYDLPPSSPPPSSSPPRVFSSPGPASLGTTPTSSPPLPLRDGPAALSPSPKRDLLGADPPVLKRKLEDGTVIGSTGTSHLPRLRERQSKRAKTEDVSPVHTPPNPIRPTPASQAKQRKKLAAPFRSPIIKGPLVQGGLHAVYATGRAPIPPPPRKARTEEDIKASISPALFKPEVPVANKDRTANVAKQFKSPLQASAVSSSVTASAPAVGAFSSVKAAPTIQALQGKVQTLKQAIKIKNSRSGEDEDEVLEGLVEKWTTAAREVAWAVWDYVKNLDPGAPDVGTKGGWFADDDGPGTKRGFNSSWGYDDGPVEKRARVDEGAEQEDEKMKEEEEEEEEPQAVHHTLGVMLRRMGIDPATLGWDEEEGDFVDVDA